MVDHKSILDRLVKDNSDLREAASTSMMFAAEVINMKEEMNKMARKMSNMESLQNKQSS